MNKLFNLLFLSVILISFHSFCNSQDYTKKSIMMFGHSKLSLLLTKHHDGFCLWDTETTDKKVINSPLGIDVLAKLRESCDKYGIKLAL